MSQCSVNSCVQGCWPPNSAAWLPVWHNLQVQAGKVVVGRQRGYLGLLSLPDEPTMRSDETADGRVGEHILVVGLPAEEAGDRDEGEVLREQTRPFLKAPRDDDAVVWRKDCVAGHDVGLRRRMRTDLAGEGERAEATGDGDGLVTVSVDDVRGKNPGGAAPSGRRR